MEPLPLGRSDGHGCQAAPATPVIPEKPAAKKASPADAEPRRGFLAGTAWVLFGSPFRLAWTAFAATMGIGGLATARFMFPNVLTEPPSQFKVGLPVRLSAGPGRHEVHGAVRRVDRQQRVQRQRPDLRPADGLHALGLHAELAGRRTKIQMSLPRQRLLQGRHQFRRAGSATARADGHPPGRRRTVGSRQEQVSRKSWASGTTRRSSWRSLSVAVREGCPIRRRRGRRFLSGRRASVAPERFKDRSTRHFKAGLNQRCPSAITFAIRRSGRASSGTRRRRSPQPHRGHADQLLPAPASGVGQEAGHRPQLHLVHGRGDVLPVPGRNGHRRAVDVLLPAHAWSGPTTTSWHSAT